MILCGLLGCASRLPSLRHIGMACPRNGMAPTAKHHTFAQFSIMLPVCYSHGMSSGLPAKLLPPVTPRGLLYRLHHRSYDMSFSSYEAGQPSHVKPRSCRPHLSFAIRMTCRPACLRSGFPKATPRGFLRCKLRNPLGQLTRPIIRPEAPCQSHHPTPSKSTRRN